MTLITYSKAVSASTPSTQSTVTLSTLDSSEFDTFFDAISKKLNETNDAKTSINDLEEQVQSTSTKITSIKQNFQNQFDGLAQSMTTLTQKVDTQYLELTNTINQLSNTIK
jgi:chromosome segregation ATPase